MKWPRLHKSYGIAFYVRQFVSNMSIESILNLLFHFPCSVGYHLIVYLKSWQDALNSAAILKEMQAFQFNSYIISVLVIFYLQLNQNFPKLGDVRRVSRTNSIDNAPPVDANLLKQSIRQFFKFYGNFYDFKKQVISVHVGQWENRQFEKDQQRKYTPEQKRFVCFMTVFAFGTDCENLDVHLNVAFSFRFLDCVTA